MLANIQWNWGRPELGRNVWGVVESAISVPFFAAALVVPSALGFVAFARKGARRAMMGRMWVPIRTALVSALVVVAAVTAPNLSILGERIIHEQLSDGMKFVVMSCIMAVLLTALFVLSSLAVVGVRTAARFLFRARDGHVGLPSVLMILIGFWGLGLAMGTLSADPDGDIPFWMALWFVVIGSVSSLGLSIAELVWMVVARGVDLRRPS